MRKIAAFSLILLAGCKPPPTDADMGRDMPDAAPTFASDPLPSPGTDGAVWAVSEIHEQTIIYGVPGSPALLGLACLNKDRAQPVLSITRFSPADDGAKALLAMVGNGHIGRIPVNSDDVRGRGDWQGGTMAADTLWEPLAGPRQLTVTVPGAGMVTVNPSALPGQFIGACRNGDSLPEPEPEVEPEVEAEVEAEAEVETVTPESETASPVS